MPSAVKKLFNNKVIRNFSLLTIGNFLSQFILVFSSIKIARVLGPAEFGIFTYILVQSALYAVIAELGIRNISIRTIARDPEKSGAVLFSSLGLQLIGLIFSVILMIIYEHFAHSINTELIIYLIINVFVLNLWSSCEAIWQGHQRMGIAESINVFFSIVWLIFVIVVPKIYLNVSFIVKYYTFILLGKAVVMFIVTFSVKGIVRGRGAKLNFFEESKIIVKQSYHYYINTLVSLPTTYLSNNFLERNSTHDQLGYFNTSNRIINPVKMVVNLALSAIFPSVSNLWVSDKAKLRNNISMRFPVFVAITGVLCFCFVLISKEMVLILFGDKFIPSVLIIQYQIWFVCVFTVICFIGNIWGATDNQKLVSRYGIINSVMATPILFIGSRFSGLGLSISYLIVYVLIFPFTYFKFKKSLQLSVNITREMVFVVCLFICSILISIFDFNLILRLLTIAIVLVATVAYYFKGAGRKSKVINTIEIEV